MGAEGGDRTLGHDELARMVGLVAPDWELVDATLATAGWTALYHLDVETHGDGRRRCVLKAAPDVDRPTGIDAEARIQATVRAHTAIPVPEVLGVVDEHPDVRTPFFLMERMQGEQVPVAAVGDLPDATLRRVARESGRYLGQLHDLGFELDAFGQGVGYDRAATLRGGRPATDPALVVVREGYDDWAAQLREWFVEDLERLADSRFADLAPAVRPALARRLDALPTDLTPTLGRVDHAWFNLLVDRDAGTLSAVIDWGSRNAVPRGFDLAVVELLLAGGWWLAMPEVPDRRPVVREALLSGYREEAAVPPSLPAQRACYHLDDLVRWVAILEDRAGRAPHSIPADRIEEADAGYRELIAAELADDSG